MAMRLAWVGGVRSSLCWFDWIAWVAVCWIERAWRCRERLIYVKCQSDPRVKGEAEELDGYVNYTTRLVDE